MMAKASVVIAELNTQGLDQWVVNEHPTDDGFALEIRPRFDRISPFLVVVDLEEMETRNVHCCDPGPAGGVPLKPVIMNQISQSFELADGTPVFGWSADNEANSTSSFYLHYRRYRPSRLWVGRHKQLTLLEFS